jgi:hypothetical protein
MDTIETSKVTIYFSGHADARSCMQCETRKYLIRDSWSCISKEVRQKSMPTHLGYYLFPIIYADMYRRGQKTCRPPTCDMTEAGLTLFDGTSVQGMISDGSTRLESNL